VPHALLVDDDLAFVLGLAEAVQREGFTVSTATTLAQGREEMAREEPDVLFVDLQLPDGSGLDLVPPANGRLPPGVVFITGHASVDLAVEALRLGAADFLTKPLDFARVKMTLANLGRTRALSREIGSLRGELRRLGRFGSLVGASARMQAVYDLVAKVAPTDVPVLVVGETGTGKELVAETVHAMSRRRERPFVPVNCGAIAPGVIESELFGHERGSFTGAERTHRGYFEKADGGTLFLDEVTEMPAEAQVKLLRVLEAGAVDRVGGGAAVRVDVRVVAATNRRPDQAVAEGRLREDLLYRLNVFPIPLPPLRERGEDVVLLAEAFLEELNRGQEGPPKAFTRAALARLRAHSWPGNVRELRNVVQRAFILAPNDVDEDAIPLGAPPGGSGDSLVFRVGASVADVERRLILATLDHCAGDKRKAADILGISVKTLYNRLNVYHVS
jgi:DNA-binding NtrC family response regulator